MRSRSVSCETFHSDASSPRSRESTPRSDTSSPRSSETSEVRRASLSPRLAWLRDRHKLASQRGPLDFAERPQEYDKTINDLVLEYADAKHRIFNDVQVALENKGEEQLARAFKYIRERGILLENIKKYCDPTNRISSNVCKTLLTNYQRVSRGQSPPSSPRLHESIEDLITKFPESTNKKKLTNALQKLHKSGRDIVYGKRAADRKTYYNFKLIRSGEPELIPISTTLFNPMDFVNSRREHAKSMIQEGYLDVTVFEAKKEIAIDYFERARGIQRDQGAEASSSSPMTLVMCVAFAILANDYADKGDYAVKLSAADDGSGKLYSYYTKFGFQRDALDSTRMTTTLHRARNFCDFWSYTSQV